MSDVTALYVESKRLKDDNKPEEAISKLQEALAIDGEHVLSHLALAVLYNLPAIGQYEKACEHGEKACELEPTDPFNFTAMSVTYQRAWQGTQKQEYVQKAEDAMAKAHMLQGTPGH